MSYVAGATGAPRLAGCLMSIDCHISAIHPGGDHQIVVGEVVEIAAADPAANAKPLLFFCGRYAAVAE